MTSSTRQSAKSDVVKVAVLAAVIVLAAGCSSAVPGSGHSGPSAAVQSTQTPAARSPAPSPTPSPVSAVPASCVLLTRADARALIAGAALDPGMDVPSTDPANYSSSCTYTAPPAAPSGQVQIFVTRDVPNALTIDRSIKHKFVTVPGIADQTIEEPDNSNIFVHKAKLWVYLSIPFGATPATLERGARLIASRMPTT